MRTIILILRKFKTSFIYVINSFLSLILIFIVSQNNNEYLKVNFLLNNTVPLPKGLIIGYSYLLGNFSGFFISNLAKNK